MSTAISGRTGKTTIICSSGDRSFVQATRPRFSSHDEPSLSKVDIYDWTILGTLVGFLTLAYLLLAPVYRFLDREEEAGKEWTREALARRRREEAAGETSEENPSASPTSNGA